MDRERVRALLAENGMPTEESFVDAWMALKEPQVRVESHGFGAERKDELRMHVGMDDTVAGAVTQDPVTLDVTVWSWNVAEVPAEVVDFLPEMGPGRKRLTALDIANLLGDPFEERRWTAWGQIDVFLGPDRGDKSEHKGLGLVWMDVRDDGRYYVERGHVGRAIGVDAETMTGLVDSLIRRVRGGEGRRSPHLRDR